MSRSYLDAPTLAALDMNLATQQVATSQRKIAEKRRLEIASLLDKLIQASITHGLSLADREALTSWEEEVLKKLDTPTESNYCCNLDYERISKTLHQMLKSKVRDFNYDESQLLSRGTTGQDRKLRPNFETLQRCQELA